MENIEFDPVKEMIHLQAMYRHYKVLYRKLVLICCSEERKIVKKKRDEYKAKIDKIIELRCKNVLDLFEFIFIFIEFACS